MFKYANVRNRNNPQALIKMSHLKLLFFIFESVNDLTDDIINDINDNDNKHTKPNQLCNIN